jgi:hypothetical protein
MTDLGRRECFLEHQGNALAHHAHGVDGVDQRLRTGFQQIALGEGDHRRYHAGLAATVTVNARFASGDFRLEAAESR